MFSALCGRKQSPSYRRYTLNTQPTRFYHEHGSRAYHRNTGNIIIAHMVETPKRIINCNNQTQRTLSLVPRVTTRCGTVLSLSQNQEQKNVFVLQGHNLFSLCFNLQSGSKFACISSRYGASHCLLSGHERTDPSPCRLVRLRVCRVPDGATPCTSNNSTRYRATAVPVVISIPKPSSLLY